jgi:hypothetical protein
MANAKQGVHSKQIVSLRALMHVKRTFVSAHVEIHILMLQHKNGLVCVLALK